LDQYNLVVVVDIPSYSATTTTTVLLQQQH
jgi:hypothetical protein